MRRALFVMLALTAACSKCSSEKAVPDVAVAAITPPDAAVPEPAKPADAGLDEATLLAAYARDCDFVVERSYYELDRDLRGDECVARNIDVPTPDTFGCAEQGENCRQECGTGCLSCASECGSSCTTCRSDCEKQPAGQREACVTTCAKARVMCRAACLTTRSSCLEQSCAAMESTCEDDGVRKKQKSCPDCAELGQCMWEPAMRDDREKCLTRFPQNARECLEWCLQE